MLVVQKTGWGKSFVYFIATKLLREAGSGPALLISPLLSLMRNQIAAAERMGVRAATINSSNAANWENIKTLVKNNEVDILLISPERLANEDFQEEVISEIGNNISLLVIDEAHCVSDWGHDFRPDYQRIERISGTLPSNTQLLATTATANNRVMDDLVAIFGPDIEVIRGDLNRPSLHLQTIDLPGQSERLAWLAERLEEIPGSGIIYTLTIRDAETVTEWLRSQGFKVSSYTGESKNREVLESNLLENRVKALVATTALGMGFDKPDISFVFHYQTPGSVVHYYQQVGRAGRQLDEAYGVLLSGSEDTEITDFFIRNSFPRRDEVEQVLEALKMVPHGLSISEMEQWVNMRYGRIELATKLLALESPAPIVRQGNKYQLTTTRLSNKFWERAERLTNLRYQEQEQMQHYVALESGHMEFLISALDGNSEEVNQPSLAPLPAEIREETVQKAINFLRRINLDIPPRLQWPSRQGIQRTLIAEPGKALCYWSDAGWGRLVRSGKYHDNRFSEELVSASEQVIREWNTDPVPAWVTCIPSSRHPDLVPDFANRLADRLGLPFYPALIKTANRPEQKTMENSTMQAQNVQNSLSLDKRDVPNNLFIKPVLLVDDIVDSRWTLTIAATLLKSQNCQAVFPFALSNAAVRN